MSDDINENITITGESSGAITALDGAMSSVGQFDGSPESRRDERGDLGQEPGIPARRAVAFPHVAARLGDLDPAVPVALCGDGIGIAGEQVRVISSSHCCTPRR